MMMSMAADVELAALAVAMVKTTNPAIKTFALPSGCPAR